MYKRIISIATAAVTSAGMVLCDIPKTYAEEKESWVYDVFHSKDYEDKSAGDTIYKGSYYNITVQPDPTNPDNLCSMEVATNHDTQGFSDRININPAVTAENTFIVEEDVMFTSWEWMEYQMYLRFVDGENGHGYGMNLWSINSQNVFGIIPDYNTWYKIRCMVDCSKSQYSVYLIDSNGNYRYEKRDIPLTEGLDHTMGIKEAYVRYQGTINTNATVYTDNLKMYTINREGYEEKVRNDYLEAEKKMKFYSDEAGEKLADAVVLYIGGPYSFVNNAKKLIDDKNPNVVPIIEDGRTLVPVRFISENTGASVEWSEISKKITVKKAGTEIVMNVDSPVMLVNGEPVELDVPPAIKENRTLLPLRALCEALGKTVFWDDAGLIVISDEENIFDSEKDRALIEEVVSAKYAVARPDVEIDDVSLLTEGVAERQQAFADRNSPENIKAIAKELADMLDLTRDELKTFSKYMMDGKYREALAEYRNIFLDTARSFGDEYFKTSFLFPQLLDAARTKVKDIKADMMLHNLIYGNNKVVSVGEPGVINWEYDKPVKKFDSDYFLMLRPFMWEYTTFDPLLYTYMATDNISYMIKWTEYIDDYCMNQNLFSDMMPYDVPDNLNGSPVTRDYIYRMKTIGNYLDGRYELFNEVTFARLLLKIMNDYLVESIVYTRNNPQNWTNDQYNDIMVGGLMMDALCLEWAEQMYRSGIRRCESFPTVAFVPDGTDIEQVVAYDIVGLRGLGWIMDTMSKIAPDKLSDKWINEYKDYAIGRGTFLTHFMTPQGNYPMGFRSDTRLRLYTIDEMRRYAPEIYDVYENEKVAQTLLGNKDAEKPSFTSEAFPYGGFYLFREGWEKTSQNALLYGHSHNVITNMGKNVFVLNAFDQDMIAAGEVGMYDHTVTQNFVDGIPQNDNAGIPTWGHKGLRISAWDVPNESRWNSSDNFDFAESEYNGVYGTGLVAKEEIEKYGGRQNYSDLDSQVYAGKNVIEGVSHLRQVNYLKKLGLWVVTDRLMSEDEHEYTTRWTLPIQEVLTRIKETYKAYNKENIEVSTKENCVRTQDEGMPNISFYNFSTSPISYKTSTEEVPETNGEKTSDFFFVDTSFKGKDEQILVTVFYPRETQSDDIVNIKSIGEKGKTAGFKATLGDGSAAGYLAAANRNEQLSIDNVSLQGESLILAKEITGNVWGVAFGSKGLTIDGELVQTDCTDFEFRISKDKGVEIIPINTPVMPVEITPAIDTFYDKLDVSMTCETEDVDIRYTLDGTEPMVDSPLYEGPVTITETTTVKARAFRKGVTENPVTFSCDKASMAVMAEYEKEPMREAVVTGELESGLNYDYFQGKWKKEFIALNDCVPVSSGKVDSVLDITPKLTKNGTFSFRYTGYIDAPVDGIYTFYAPDEYNRSECMAGYELNVYIDDEQWYPATRRFAFGSWSIPLKAGKHKFEVGYTDFRMESTKEYNREGLKKQLIWDGYTPELMISGPGIEKQLIPDSMLFRDK